MAQQPAAAMRLQTEAEPRGDDFWFVEQKLLEKLKLPSIALRAHILTRIPYSHLAVSEQPCMCNTRNTVAPFCPSERSYPILNDSTVDESIKHIE